MKRLLSWLKGLFNKLMDEVEDPMIMIDQAKRDMQAQVVKNREKAVQALTARNNIERMVVQAEHQIQSNEAAAQKALEQGNRDVALAFMREKEINAATLLQLKDSLAKADVVVTQVKASIKSQEQQFKKQLAESYALKAQYKGAQAQNDLMKALEGMSFENTLEGFGAAKEKIGNKLSEASARTEMYGETFAAKSLIIEDTAADIQAEAALQEMEKRLGLTAKVPEASLDQVLQNRVSAK